MKQNKNYWFDFAGAVILYPILTIVCIFFYVGCYFIETAPIDRINFTDLIIWYIFAILGYVFCGMWGMIKDWWNGKLVIIGALILLVSFLSFQTQLYPHIPYKDNILLVCTIVVTLCCIVPLFRISKKNKGAILWVLPVLLILLYYVTKRTRLVIPCGLVSMAILALACTWHKTDVLKWTVTIATSLFYFALSLIYYPFNPLSSFQKIVNIGISVPSRVTSLIVEKDGKYIIEDGLTMRKPVDLKFDCWTPIKPYQSAFVGFKADKFKDFECKSLEVIRNETLLFPISVKDGYVYFTSQVDTYKEMAKYKTSDNKVSKMTALIFQDFMELYQTPDSINYAKLKFHQKILQEEYTHLTTDSLIITNGVDNNEDFLRKLSRNISLGMFNALCSDLVINNDINTALTIFSYQLYFTFIDSPIFKTISSNFNVNVERSYGITTIKLSSTDLIDLKRADIIQPWVTCLTMALNYAELYSNNNEFILTLVRDVSAYNNKPATLSLLDKKPLLDLKEKMGIIKNKMGNYFFVPTIKQYSVDLQRFMYQCVSSNDFMSDYSSYFLNRFNQITPLVPMYKESENLYENMSNLYKDRFDKDIKGVQEIRHLMDSLYNQLDKSLLKQENIENMFKEAGLKLK